MLIKKIPFIATILLTSTTFSQEKKSIPIDTAAQKQQLGWANDLDTNITLNFDAIEEKQYKKYEKNYSLQYIHGKHVVHSDSIFKVMCGNPRYYKTDQFNHYAHGGLLRQFLLHVVFYTSANDGYQTMFFIDHVTGKEYQVESPFDNSFGNPLPSESGNWILLFTSNVFKEDQSCLALLKIVRNGNKFTMENYFEAIINTINVFDAVWIDDNSFAIANGSGDYYKVTWKKG